MAEKPKVARVIAYAIGEEVAKKRYKNIYYYEIKTGEGRALVASAVGHVYSLAEKEKKARNYYPVFDIAWFPAYEVSKDASYTRNYIDLISILSKKADVFVSACDYDIEGSTIAYNLFRFATPLKEGRRMKYSALTKKDLRDAYERQMDFDYLNAYAGETRHIVDWYYGINLSRALMSALKKANKFRILSIGRVQGPTLSILSSLERQIRSFQPQPYWEVKIKIKGITFTHKKGKFFDEEEAKQVVARVEKSARISKQVKELSIPPLPNFDLTSLQTEAYRVFGYSPSYTLSLAQELYESSLITYPRTSSQQIPPTINSRAILQTLLKQAEFEDASWVLSRGRKAPVQGKKRDPAHPAIHPTGLAPKSLPTPHKNLYTLIARRFIASFGPSALKEAVALEAVSGGEVFVAKGSRIKEQGWLALYRFIKPEETAFPSFAEEEEVESKRRVKKHTKPPKRHSQASIVSELEKRQLGTKATRAVIVDTLFKRGYLSGNPIKVTDFGLKICDILSQYAPKILDENLTREMEMKMEGIVEGKVSREEVIEESKEILKGILEEWKAKEEQIGEALARALMETLDKESVLGECECGGKLRIIKVKGKKQFVGCSNYPACTLSFPLPPYPVSPKGTCKCGKPQVLVVMRGKRFTACIDPNCPYKKKKENKS